MPKDLKDLKPKNKRHWRIRGDKDSMLVSWDENHTSSPFMGFYRVAKITSEQLAEIEGKLNKANIITSLTEESEFLIMSAGEARKHFPEAGKGSVGFLDIAIEDAETMILLAESSIEERSKEDLEKNEFVCYFDIYWVHLYIE